MTVRFVETREFPLNVPVVVIGAGACGLSAALAAHDAGAEVLVIERDSTPAGSTALSSGFIPASFTRFQRAAGIADSPESMAADIQRKNAAGADPRVVAAVCRASGPTLEWLADAHGVPFILVEGFLYPGHSAMRMHAVPEKTGAALMAALLSACGKAAIDILTDARVTTLYADASKRVRGIAFERPDGSVEEVGCTALVLACSGFGGNAQRVARHIPELAGVAYFGHAGNQGDAARWGEQLGAALTDMSAYQGHGSVATPHGILITWALMMEGGVQVNVRGERFSNEHQGYSEQCVRVLAQPGRVAWSLYDERLHRLGMEFPDYREAEALGAVKRGNTLTDLAAATGLPGDALQRTLDQTGRFAAGKESDPYGRDFAGKPVLRAPFYAAKVTGALFHTQGGLEIDAAARVLGRDRRPLPNLFAGGGAARGLSGARVWGYLSGNGLLSAVVLGRLAGESASRLAGLV
ncbi:MAG: FAD-dependent oxidoreductase [Burkholderiales bacterium]